MVHDGRSRSRAHVAAVTAFILFGVSLSVIKIAIREVAPVIVMVARYGQAGLLLFATQLVARRSLRIPRRDLAFVWGLGILCCGGPVVLTVGLQFTESSRAALMLSTVPLWSALLGRMFGKERLGPGQYAGIALSMLGVLAALVERGLHFDSSASALLGDGLAVLNAVTLAIYGVLVQRVIPRYGATTVAGYAMIAGAIKVAPLALVEAARQDWSRVTAESWLCLLYLGTAGGGLAFFLLHAALGRMSPTRVQIYSHLNAVVPALIGVLALYEQFSGATMLGFALIFAGIAVMNLGARAAPS